MRNVAKAQCLLKEMNKMFKVDLPEQKPTWSSEPADYAALKKRIAELEYENRRLKDQIKQVQDMFPFLRDEGE